MHDTNCSQHYLSFTYVDITEFKDDTDEDSEHENDMDSTEGVNFVNTIDFLDDDELIWNSSMTSMNTFSAMTKDIFEKLIFTAFH